MANGVYNFIFDSLLKSEKIYLKQYLMLICQFFFKFSGILTSESSLLCENNAKQISVASFHYLQKYCLKTSFCPK